MYSNNIYFIYLFVLFLLLLLLFFWLIDCFVGSRGLMVREQ